MSWLILADSPFQPGQRVPANALWQRLVLVLRVPVNIADELHAFQKPWLVFVLPPIIAVRIPVPERFRYLIMMDQEKEGTKWFPVFPILEFVLQIPFEEPLLQQEKGSQLFHGRDTPLS